MFGAYFLHACSSGLSEKTQQYAIKDFKSKVFFFIQYQLTVSKCRSANLFRSNISVDRALNLTLAFFDRKVRLIHIYKHIVVSRYCCIHSFSYSRAPFQLPQCPFSVVKPHFSKESFCHKYLKVNIYKYVYTFLNCTFFNLFSIPEMSIPRAKRFHLQSGSTSRGSPP